MRKSTTYLRTEDVSRWTGIPENTLKSWRREGRGPAYLNLGRRVYYRDDLVQEWLDVQERVTLRGGEVA